MRPSLLLAVAAATYGAHAFDIPLQVPFDLGKLNGSTEAAESTRPPQTPSSVAIIGAGAGGSSAAFWIGLAKARWGLDIDVDVYESLDRVGGRSTTVYPYGNKSLAPMELGASIFVAANKNLWRATDVFNLTRIEFEDDSIEDDSVGIWDGETFPFVMSGTGWLGGWLNTAKLFWRYGWTSPIRTKTIVGDLIKTILRLYSRETPLWTDYESLAETLKWSAVVAQSTAEFYERMGVSRQFTYEMVEAATRVNYGQNADKIHALEGGCSLAAEGARSVKGGNWQIFDKFLQSSGARLFLNTTVSFITKKSGTKWTVETTTGGSREYKNVIIAAPFHQTGITLHSDKLANDEKIIELIPPQPYVHLHVTLLSTTTKTPNPEYFSLGAEGKVPTTILTTYDAVRTRGGKEPEFNSLTYHGLVRQPEEGEEPEYLVKVFSKERVSDQWLSNIFSGKVGWVYRKEFDAYPELPPTEKFPAIILDEGLYYVNAMEPFISTMETETVAARNIVDLLLGREYGTSICGSSAQSAADTTKVTVGSIVQYWLTSVVSLWMTKDEFVYGYDC